MPKKNYEILENEDRGRFRDRLRLLWLLKSGKAKTMEHSAELAEFREKLRRNGFAVMKSEE